MARTPSRTRPARRRNAVSEDYKAGPPEEVEFSRRLMERVFVENPRRRKNPRTPRRRNGFLDYMKGVEERGKKKGRSERAVGTAQTASAVVSVGAKAAPKVAAKVAAKVGAKVGAKAIPVVGQALMVIGGGKELAKAGYRHYKHGFDPRALKTDAAKVGAGIIGVEDFVPDYERPAKKRTKKNPPRSRRVRPQVYFDMDETLLHSVLGGGKGLVNISVSGLPYGVSVRPDAHEALHEAARHADVYVLTTADRHYALKALDAAGLLGPGSPIRAVYSTREAEDVPPPAKNWVLLDNDPLSAMEKTTVLVGYDAPERVTLVPDYLALPRAGRTSLLTGLKKALRVLGEV